MISTNVSLKQFNTFGIEASAKRFSIFSSTKELKALLGNRLDDDLLILGGGSNVLLTQDYDGLVLKNEIRGFTVVEDLGDSVLVKAGGGEVWHEFVMKCIEKGYGGIENLSLIPGSVGASPMQNIGAYGTEVKDVFHSLEAFEIETGEIHIFNKEKCEFGYRESVFKRKLKGRYIITTVTFKLNKIHSLNSSYGAIESQLVEMGISNPSIRDISNAVIAIRSSKLPNPDELGNAGSFFKNPVVPKEILIEIQKNFENVPSYPANEGCVKLAAGWLIEQAGWKGKTKNNFGVHKNQALVLVNYGGATGEEILEFSQEIIRDVERKFGLTLEREVNII